MCIIKNSRFLSKPTTEHFLLKSDYNTVVEVLRILKWFKSISGLDINKEKTNVVKLGATRGRSIPWQGKIGFKWATNFEILGIHYDINHKRNYRDKYFQENV